MVKRKTKEKHKTVRQVIYPIVKSFLEKRQPRVSVQLGPNYKPLILAQEEASELYGLIGTALSRARDLQKLHSQVDEIECYLDSMTSACDDFRQGLKDLDDLTEDNEALDIDILYNNLQSDLQDLTDTVGI